jgi:hypothetical protein
MFSNENRKPPDCVSVTREESDLKTPQFPFIEPIKVRMEYQQTIVI